MIFTSLVHVGNVDVSEPKPLTHTYIGTCIGLHFKTVNQNFRNSTFILEAS